MKKVKTKKEKSLEARVAELEMRIAFLEAHRNIQIVPYYPPQNPQFPPNTTPYPNYPWPINLC